MRRGGLVPHWQVLTPLSQELWWGSEQRRQLGGVGGGARSAFPFCVRKIKIIIEDDVGTKQFCDLAYKWKLDEISNN